MALAAHVDEFIKLCESGATLAAIERFYAEDVVVFENHAMARAGRAACLAFERKALAAIAQPARLRARARAVDEARQVAFIEWTIHFVGENARPMRLEEVAVQRWSGGQIAQERFYYEGMIDEGDEGEAAVAAR